MMKPNKFSTKYPPSNRSETGLGVLEIEITGAAGTLKLDPNRAAMIGYSGELPIEDPCWPSTLSGEPGFRYRTCDGVDLSLTPPELIRLLRHDLAPEEVLELHNAFGAFFETHDDFYDEQTGAALQPMESKDKGKALRPTRR